ncbi:MAG: carboxypeptidase regulatory-like domain-containing protein [Saprospiraceae bacterium]
MAALLLLVVQAAWGQGSTSSRITGQITDGTETLIGANVIAVHEPTGFQYGTATNIEGLFTLNNVNVGGPYTITVSYTGFEEYVIKDIFLNLGQTESFNIKMNEAALQLSEVVVTAGGLFDGNRTGSETKVSEEAIAALPSADRGLNDYLRLTPQADVANNGATNGGGISFSGVNNRFNAIFIDGAVNNDVFGLANSGTNGGQAGISPISPDALEQIQVVLAPYDVTLGGFAGGGINAVTRSGTNTLTGSAYYFNRNENLSGKTPTDNDNAERTKLAPFTARTFGGRLGGALIKNKLFFFANVEIQRDEIPRPFIQSEYNGDSDANQLNAIRQKLINDFGYDPGGFENNPQTVNGEKVLVKLDYNINKKHKLSARHSYVKGTTEIHPSPSASRVVFGNTGYLFPSTTHSTAIELKSILSPNTANNLIIGRTTVNDDRDILGDPFPQIIMPDGNGTVVVGTDNFSYSNIVNQDVFTITNNFNLYKGKHSFTFGTHNEFFKIENLFAIFSTPRYEYFFNGVNRFLAGENADISLFGHEQASGGDNIRLGDAGTNLGPAFNAMQLAFYGQDEIQVNKDFKVTIGLRFDVPIFTDDPPLDNTAFNNTTIPLLEAAGYDLKGARASQAPATQILVSPRIGFNYDVNGDKSTQLRGGVGVFTSRVPWVWPGGMFIRNGLNSAFNVGFGVGQQEIYGTPTEWLQNLTSDVSPTGDVDLFTKDFKYPQILRASLAMDKKLPWGMDGTAEITFTKTLNNMDVKQINIRPSTANLSGADNRPVIDFNTKIDPTYQNVTLVDNTNKGYTFNITAQLSKQFAKNSTANLAYSFTRADALVDGRGFINNTNWLNILSVQGNNNPGVTRSSFDAGSRLTAFIAHKFEYSDFAATTLSIFYTAKSGSPYSFVYNSSATSDISQSADYNDLIYIPANQGDINLVDIDGGATAAQQWTALDQFISGNDYLNSRRGDYAEANEVRTPFEGVLDLKIIQDFYIGGNDGGTRHNFQVTFDVFNFTNMFNKNWGRRYFVGGNTFPLIQANRSDEGELQYNFVAPNGSPYNIVQSGTYSARWNAQLGLRYSF